MTVPAATPTGNYNFQAQGVSGALTRTFNMTLEVFTQSVAPFALSMDPTGNNVFQPNETVTMAPTWRNTGSAPINLTGVTSSFTGPAGAAYTNPDNTANYGTIGVAATAAARRTATATASRATAATRPLTHWDSTILETVTPTATTKTWTLHIGDSFTDVPPTQRVLPVRRDDPAQERDRRLHADARTARPTPRPATRWRSSCSRPRRRRATPRPPASPPNLFTDVPETSPFCRWIEELASRGVVTGCGAQPVLPDRPRHA